MTRPRIVRRPAAAGSGTPRLSREMVQDLEPFFSGQQPSCWALLIPPECDWALPEVLERWNAFLATHPGTPMPPALAALIGLDLERD